MEITMREAAAQLDQIEQQLCELIKASNKEQPGGFENELVLLRVHTTHVHSLLLARIAGQLVDTPVESLVTNRLYDKALSRA